MYPIRTKKLRLIKYLDPSRMYPIQFGQKIKYLGNWGINF